MPKGTPNDKFRDPKRFMGRIDPQESGCWNWDAPTNTGYGSFRYKGKSSTAHRASYLIFIGQIPENHDVHHKCENRICVYPGHLELLTQNIHGSIHSPNTGKTHCKRGHPLSGENVSLKPKGRTCVTCYKMKQKEWRERNKI